MCVGWQASKRWWHGMQLRSAALYGVGVEVGESHGARQLVFADGLAIDARHVYAWDSRWIPRHFAT